MAGTGKLSVYIVILLLLSCSAVWGLRPSLSFVGEELSFRLGIQEPGVYLWELEGDYYFCNEWPGGPLSWIVRFPFPQGENIISTKGLRVELIDPEEGLELSFLEQFCDETGFSFRLTMPGLGFAKVRICYSQELSESPAVYIVTSTKSWGKPLEFSNISLALDHSLVATSLPFEDPVIESGDQSTSYHWELRDFWPDEELILHFGEVDSISGGQ